MTELKDSDNRHIPTKNFMEELQKVFEFGDEKYRDDEIAKKTSTPLRKTRKYLKYLVKKGRFEKVGENIYRPKKKRGKNAN